MKRRNNLIVLALVAGLSWSALPAMAEVDTTISSADPYAITITNHADTAADYWVRVYDGDMSFTLDPGTSRTFRSSPTFKDSVYWAVSYGDGTLIGRGWMSPLEYGEALPDEVIAAGHEAIDAEAAAVAPVADDTDWVRGDDGVAVDPDQPVVLIPPVVVIHTLSSGARVV